MTQPSHEELNRKLTRQELLDKMDSIISRMDCFYKSCLCKESKLEDIDRSIYVDHKIVINNLFKFHEYDEEIQIKSLKISECMFRLTGLMLATEELRREHDQTGNP